MFRAHLELVRPGNVATAMADVLAGFAVAKLANPRALPGLLVATTCLYAGGIVLNDFFDRHIDAIERPERPIPSGRVPAARAAAVGLILLLVGVCAATFATREAGIVAGLIVASVVSYDTWGKRQMFLGPVNMGVCRGLNLLLGMAAVSGTISGGWRLALIPVAYISAVTAISRGEVAGGKRPAAILALGLMTLVIIALVGVSMRTGQLSFTALAYTVVLAWTVLPAFWRACENPQPGVIRHAVRTGVLSLVLIDAAIAAAYASMIYSLAVLATAALASLLARRFAVT